MKLSAIALQLTCGSAMAMDCFWDDFCDRVSVEGSFLYWKLYGDNFDDLNVRNNNETNPIFVGEEKDYTQSMDWEPGFRVGLGFDLPCVGIDVQVDWTDFHTSKTDRENIFGQSGSVTTSLESPYLPESNIYEFSGTNSNVLVKQREHFDFDVVNLEFGKWFSPACTCLSLRPHIGLQFVQLEEKRSFFSSSFTDEQFVRNRNFHTHQRFRGYGLRSGVDMRFPLFCDISLVGGAAASIDWGRRTTRLNYDSFFSSEESSGNNFHQKRHDHTNRSILDLNIGLRWETTLCDCWGFALEALWEQHQLFNASQLWRLGDDLSPTGQPFGNTGDKHGDLSLRGLTLKGELTF